MILQCLAQVAVIEVRVNLCRENILVAEQLLHLTYAGATLKKMRCEGVAKCMRADLLRYAGTLTRLLEDSEYHHSCKALASIVQEQSILAAVYPGAFILV